MRKPIIISQYVNVLLTSKYVSYDSMLRCKNVRDLHRTKREIKPNQGNLETKLS